MEADIGKTTRHTVHCTIYARTTKHDLTSHTRLACSHILHLAWTMAAQHFKGWFSAGLPQVLSESTFTTFVDQAEEGDFLSDSLSMICDLSTWNVEYSFGVEYISFCHVRALAEQASQQPNECHQLFIRQPYLISNYPFEPSPHDSQSNNRRSYTVTSMFQPRFPIFRLVETWLPIARNFFQCAILRTRSLFLAFAA
jgi:hypothetical protein